MSKLMTMKQARVVELMRAHPKCELYQGLEYTHCYLTYSGHLELEYEPLTIAEAMDLKERGLIIPKWADRTDLNYWRLGNKS